MAWGVSRDPGLPAPDTPGARSAAAGLTPPRGEQGERAVQCRGELRPLRPQPGPPHTEAASSPPPCTAQARGAHRERGAGAQGHKQQHPSGPGGDGEPTCNPGQACAAQRAAAGRCGPCARVMKCMGTRVSPDECVSGAECVQMHMRVVSVHVCACVLLKGRHGRWHGARTGQGWAGTGRHRVLSLAGPCFFPLRF